MCNIVFDAAREKTQLCRQNSNVVDVLKLFVDCFPSHVNKADDFHWGAVTGKHAPDKV